MVIPNKFPESFKTQIIGLNKARCIDETLRFRNQLKSLIPKVTADKKGFILVLQGIDASGKDGLIQRNLEVLVLPNLRVAHFRKPSALELSHDFLWRIYQQVPKRGEIVVFNRSHYEDILVPESLGDLEHDELQGRYASIVNFEEHLLRSGIHTFKFFLNIDYKVQGKKLEERLTNPEKRHKYKDSDLETRKRWVEIMSSYAGIFKNCNSPYPWVNIPADKKWQKDYVFCKELIRLFQVHI